MGIFVVIEGPDGTGKTTLVNGLKKKFTENNISFYAFREPGGTEVGEKLRDILLDPSLDMTHETEALLFAAMRCENVRKVKEKISENDIILADRFILSSIAYQGYGLGLDPKKVEMINDFGIYGFRPDLTIVLMMDSKDGISRKKTQKDLDRLEQRDLDFHKRLEDAYRQFISEDSDKVVIDANKSKEEILEEAFSIIKENM